MKFLSKLLLPKIYIFSVQVELVLSKDAHKAFFSFLCLSKQGVYLSVVRSYAVFIPVEMK